MSLILSIFLNMICIFTWYCSVIAFENVNTSNTILTVDIVFQYSARHFVHLCYLNSIYDVAEETPYIHCHSSDFGMSGLG